MIDILKQMQNNIDMVTKEKLIEFFHIFVDKKMAAVLGRNQGAEMFKVGLFTGGVTGTMESLHKEKAKVGAEWKAEVRRQLKTSLDLLEEMEVE